MTTNPANPFTVYRSPLTVLLACLLLLLGLSSAAAQERMYWTDDINEAKIQRANLDGANAESLVTNTIHNPEGIALDLDADKVYWMDSGADKIQRADLDGSNAEDLIATGLSDPHSIALDVFAGKMYWTDIGAGTILRANMEDGSNIEDLITDGMNPAGIALDVSAGKMYWMDMGDGTILRANMEDGSNEDPLVIGLGVLDTSGFELNRGSSIALDVPAGKMYWTDRVSGKIQRANLDGTSVEDLIIGLHNPQSIALDVSAGKMYWARWMWYDMGSIQRANLEIPQGRNASNRTDIENLVTTARRFSPWGVALDVSAGKMYWTDWDTNRILRTDLDGSNVENVVANRVFAPEGIALDVPAGKMYWADAPARSILRADLDGSNIEDLVTTGLTLPRGIALDVSGGKMYWTELQKIQQANLDGSNVENLVTGLNNPYGIALHVSAGKMYWTDSGAQKIQRSNLDGSNIENLVTANLVEPHGIALDVSAGKIYWTDYNTGKIQRADLDGAHIKDLVTTEFGGPWGIALDVSGGKMYWTYAWTSGSQNKIQRADLDGANEEDLFVRIISSFGLKGIALELAPSYVSLSPYGIDFGAVPTGTVQDTTFTLTNTSTDTLRITGVTTTDSVFTTTDTTLALAPGGFAAVAVTFAPADRGSVNAQVVLTSDAPSSPHIVGLLGEGRTVQTMAITADTSTVVYQDADGTVAAVTFTTGPVAGHTLTVESFGPTPPSSVQSVPPFTSPVFYMGFNSTIPFSVSFQATVTFTYTDAQLDSAGITDEDSLKVAWFNETTEVWNTVTGVLDAANNRLTFTTGHFLVFALAMITPTGIEDGPHTALPSDFVLHATRPNPFNPSTTISYEVSRSAHVTLVVYNILGQEVIRLVDGQKTAGRYTVVWHGRNARRQAVASGIYVYRMTSSNGFNETKRMTLIK